MTKPQKDQAASMRDGRKAGPKESPVRCEMPDQKP